MTRLYLTDFRERQNLSPNLTLLQLLATNREQSAELGKKLLQTAETEAEFDRRLSLIETILANKFTDLTKEMVMQLLDLKQTDITQSRFYQEIRQEGRQEGEAALLIRQLTRRLGALSEVQVGQIQQLSIANLEELGEALLDFTVMTDLDDFLLELV